MSKIITVPERARTTRDYPSNEQIINPQSGNLDATTNLTIRQAFLAEKENYSCVAAQRSLPITTGDLIIAHMRKSRNQNPDNY
jgi:hypothetical protein